MHVTAVHLVERVLPLPYRQWTLSFLHRVRWALLMDAGLGSDVFTVFLRAVFTQQRQKARRQGPRGAGSLRRAPRGRQRECPGGPLQVVQNGTHDGRGCHVGEHPAPAAALRANEDIGAKRLAQQVRPI